jgi:hypothetical protein
VRARRETRTAATSATASAEQTTIMASGSLTDRTA